MNLQGAYYKTDGGAGSPLTFAVDEMSVCYPLNVRDGHPFTELCNMGRHYGVRLIGATQRPAEIGATFRGNPKATYCFRLESDLDVDRMAKIMGLKDRQELRSLPVGHYLRFEGGKIFREKTKKIA